MTLRYRPGHTTGAPSLPEANARPLAEIRAALTRLDKRQAQMLKVLLVAEKRAIQQIEAAQAKRFQALLLPVGLSVLGSLLAAYLIGHSRGLQNLVKEGPEEVIGP